MKAESSIKPGAFNVEQCGEIAEITMYENVTQEVRDGEIVFVYDEHRLNVPWRENLSETIKANKAKWLQAAKTAQTEEQKPSIAEEVAILKAENTALRLGNEITGAAVEELISVMFGGE